MDKEKFGGGYNIEENPEQGLSDAKEEVVGDVDEFGIVPVEYGESVGELAKGDEYVSQIEVFDVGMGAVERLFGEEAASHIKNELSRIDDIQSRTIGVLNQAGTLSDGAKKLTIGLGRYGVDADNLTVEEAQSVYDYAINATDEIAERKVNRLYDAIISNINGARSRRDGHEPAYWNEEEYNLKTAVQDKFVKWERGELDLENGFDPEAVYEHLLEEGYDPSEILKEHIETSEWEDLVDEGLVDEDDDSFMYVYGPFTKEDLASLEPYFDRYWTSITNQRFNAGTKIRKRVSKTGEPYKEISYRSGANLMSLMNETVKPGVNGVEGDLICDFVANEILQNRRLGSKEMLMVSSALALDILGQEKEDVVDQDELKFARKTISWVAYYSAKMLGYRENELKNRFGSVRPLSKEFFEEIAEAANNLPESRSEYLDEFFKQYLTKMDEHVRDLLDYEAVLSDDDNNKQSVYSDKFD